MASSLLRPAIVLGLMSLIGPFAIDMYLPAMPSIAVDLDTTAQGMQGTITAYFAGFGLGQLIYGPWSDQAGRKRPLYVAMVIFILGTLLCLLADSAGALQIGRLVQGLGGAALAVVPRAIIRDQFTGEQATRLMALLMLVFSVSPMLAPLAGAGIMQLAGWRYLFAGLLVVTLASLAVLHFLQPETLSREGRQKFRWADMGHAARTLVVDRTFVTLTMMGATGIASFFVFLTAAPFVYSGTFGLSPMQFSLAFTVNAAAFIGGGQLAGPLMGRFGAMKVMRAASAVFAAAGLLLAALAWADVAGLFTCMALLALGNAGLGLIIPTSMVMALEDHGPIAGMASSLGGTVQMLAGGALVAIAGPWLTDRLLPMAVLVAACAVATLVLALLARAPQAALRSSDSSAKA